jgi:hypothetical protein
MWSARYEPTFQRDVLPPSSALKVSAVLLFESTLFNLKAR